MQTASSSSLPPRKPGKAAGPTHPLPPSIKHPQTPAKRVQPPPKEIKRADDPKKCSTAFSKRSQTILGKVEGIHKRTGAPVAVIMISRNGKVHHVGKPSVEEVFYKYLIHKVEETIHKDLRHKGEVIPPMSRETTETLAALIKKLKSYLDYLHKKLKNFKEGDRLLISPVDLAASSGSSGVESTPMCSDHEDTEVNFNSFLGDPKFVDLLDSILHDSEANPIGLHDSAVGDGSA